MIKGQTGVGMIRNPEIQRLRAMEMLQMNVSGMNQQEIAEKFGCHRDTVKRSLEYAVREGLTQRYENQLIQRLVPAALSVIETAITDKKDVKAALHIIDKMVKLGERFSVREVKDNEFDLDAYVAAAKYGAPQKPISGKVIILNDQPSPTDAGGTHGTLPATIDSLSGPQDPPPASTSGVESPLSEILLSEISTVGTLPTDRESD